MALWVGGRSEEAAAAARVAIDVATELDYAPAAVRGCVALGVSLLTLLDFSGSRAALEQGLAVAERSGDKNLETMVLIRLPLVTGLVGDIPAFQRFANRALELTQSLDATQEAEFALAALCNLAGSRGDFITTERMGTEVQSIARLTGSPWALPFVLATMAATRALQGDAAGATEAARALLPADPGFAAFVADSPAHRVLEGFVAVLAGDLATAAERVHPAVVGNLIDQPAVLGNGAYLAAVIEIARALDQPEMAEAVRPGLEDLIAQGQLLSAGMPFLLTRSLAVTDLLAGRFDDAREFFDEALTFAKKAGLRVEVARTLLDMADLMVLSGDRRASTDLRAEAAVIVEALEMWALAPRAGVRTPIEAEPVHRAVAAATPMEATRSVVLFADISASTALTEELGDIAFRHRARQAEAIMRSAVAAGGGRAIEGIRLGDGILADFASAHGAVVAGLTMIEAMGPVGLQVHVGVHAGEVIREAHNIFGGAVNMTARICDAADAGQLVVSSWIAEELDGGEFEVAALGARTLKGFDLPVTLFAVADRERP
jgi:class 3 adenylate cyclase